MPGTIRSMHLEYVFRDVQTNRGSLLHGRLLWWQFDTVTLAHRCRRGASTPSPTHHKAFIPTTSWFAPVLRLGTLVLAVCAAWTSPLASERQVLTFRTRAWLSFAPPTCRMPLGQASGFSQADPGGRGTPRFRHRLPGSGPDVSATLTTIALDDSNLRWLETCT